MIIDKEYFRKAGFSPAFTPNKSFEVTFGKNLKMTDKLKDSLVLGVSEFIAGSFALNRNKGYQEADDLTIPTDFGIRGGIFSAQVDFEKGTAHISGYISGGEFSENNPDPVKYY